MMKKYCKVKVVLTFLITLLSTVAYTQTGSISGVVTDKEFNDEPLPQANVLIKGTQRGTVTDFDGLFTIDKVDAGTYSLEVSFVGYETKTVPVTVTDGQDTKVTISLAGSAVAMDEVVIKAAPTKRESETALLVQQKKAVEIKESIGAQQLAKLGVSDAAAATTKISGVTKSEGSGDVFVRGLGDRYLYTTLNGLPIPSDDVERKNIDLGLFSTGLISSVDISKTTSSLISADQASGNIDIKTKEMTGDDYLSFSTSTGFNTNVTFSDHKVTANNKDLVFGYYRKSMPTKEAVINQTWATDRESLPINRSLSVTFGKKINDKLKFVVSLGQATDYNYSNGVFRNFANNILVDSISDVINWRNEIKTTGLFNLNYKASDKNKFKLTSLLINKTVDNVYEGGRAGDAIILDATDDGSGLFQFIRDQNTLTTLLLVEQLHGNHRIGEKHNLDYSLGYNILKANEPNRIRNEANFNINTGETRFPVIGGPFQQRKSYQLITDNEINARINDKISFIEDDSEDGDGQSFGANFGANFRHKSRNFTSQFFGAEKDSKYIGILYFESIDDLHKIFTPENFKNNILNQKTQQKDLYNAKLQSIAAYTDFKLKINKFNAQLGLRYQKDNIFVDFDVADATSSGREGTLEKIYESLYPSVNLKYSINEKHSIRLSNSSTITLPEFKEIAPFGYVPPVGQLVKGNPELEASKNINYDIKWEFFPDRSQLLSLTGFYKTIKNPINKVRDRGAANRLSFFNSGEEAEIYGLETEIRVNLIKEDEEALEPKSSLKLNVNASRLWHKQDLLTRYNEKGEQIVTYKYNSNNYIGLQGASDWVSNVSLNFNNNKEFPFDANLTANYSSDKIFSLGNPTNQYESEIAYNESIVEKGFVTLDIILGKKINKKLDIKLSGKNLLNPTIRRTQLINSSISKNDLFEKERDVLSYKRGAQIGLSLNYKI